MAELARYCASFCRTLTVHHSIEDRQMFPALRRADPRLGPVLDRLLLDHRGIHQAILDVEAELRQFTVDDLRIDRLQVAVAALRDQLLVHLEYEEQTLVGPAARAVGETCRP